MEIHTCCQLLQVVIIISKILEQETVNESAANVWNASQAPQQKELGKIYNQSRGTIQNSESVSYRKICKNDLREINSFQTTKPKVLNKSDSLAITSSSEHIHSNYPAEYAIAESIPIETNYKAHNINNYNNIKQKKYDDQCNRSVDKNRVYPRLSQRDSSVNKNDLNYNNISDDEDIKTKYYTSNIRLDTTYFYDASQLKDSKSKKLLSNSVSLGNNNNNNKLQQSCRNQHNTHESRPRTRSTTSYGPLSLLAEIKPKEIPVLPNDGLHLTTYRHCLEYQSHNICNSHDTVTSKQDKQSNKISVNSNKKQKGLQTGRQSYTGSDQHIFVEKKIDHKHKRYMGQHSIIEMEKYNNNNNNNNNNKYNKHGPTSPNKSGDTQLLPLYHHKDYFKYYLPHKQSNQTLAMKHVHKNKLRQLNDLRSMKSLQKNDSQSNINFQFNGTLDHIIPKLPLSETCQLKMGLDKNKWDNFLKQYQPSDSKPSSSTSWINDSVFSDYQIQLEKQRVEYLTELEDKLESISYIFFSLLILLACTLLSAGVLGCCTPIWWFGVPHMLLMGGLLFSVYAFKTHSEYGLKSHVILLPIIIIFQFSMIGGVIQEHDVDYSVIQYTTCIMSVISLFIYGIITWYAFLSGGLVEKCNQLLYLHQLIRHPLALKQFCKTAFFNDKEQPEKQKKSILEAPTTSE